ncbi:OLC1v1011188C1 [Oldenlandia corymbosa var. corymbosa]|uniref:OLC1v1011188C1 n=1 Tax=Oldenlandia corymbosa var. corymbosa TaxID=529605 RepID=A0AAV1DTB4_OLDCO|nr:OLC1v1011188C1 [Oldenlandia corymbosa var. corymbosa]
MAWIGHLESENVDGQDFLRVIDRSTVEDPTTDRSEKRLTRFCLMAETKTMRKPVFTKIDQLRPGTNGHNLVAKVVSSKTVLQKGCPDGPQVRQMRIAECLIGDETGTIVFTARNDQVELMKPDATIVLRNAKIDMFKGSMRLAVDKWGRVEVTESASFTVKEDNNLSLIEYELVNVVEE